MNPFKADLASRRRIPALPDRLWVARMATAGKSEPRGAADERDKLAPVQLTGLHRMKWSTGHDQA
jgi:hypothetical protein